jgi:hypothetical protein
MDTRPTERGENFDRSFGRGAAVSSEMLFEKQFRPRSSVWIEQQFPKLLVGRSNRLGGTKY